jgi:septum formation inhibitor MinC
MRLYIEPMDATLVEINAEGQIRLQDDEWRPPTFQERRAIIYSAQNELAELSELLEILGGTTNG